MGLEGGKRGLLKPEQRLKWKETPPLPKAKVSADPGRSPQDLKAKAALGLPSNALPQSQYTLEQLKKMAQARGLSVEKLLAQMVQQYMKED